MDSKLMVDHRGGIVRIGKCDSRGWSDGAHFDRIWLRLELCRDWLDLKCCWMFGITAPNWPWDFFQSKRGTSSWTRISFRYHKYTINQHINAKKMGSDTQICMTQFTHSFTTKVTSNPCTPTFDWIIAAQIQHPPNQKWSFKWPIWAINMSSTRSNLFHPNSVKIAVSTTSSNLSGDFGVFT